MKPFVNEDLSNWGEWVAKVNEMMPAVLLSLDLQKVRREGRVESKREDLLEVLRGRFGALPPAVEQRVNDTTDIPTLTAAIRVAGTVATPDDLPL